MSCVLQRFPLGKTLAVMVTLWVSTYIHPSASCDIGPSNAFQYITGSRSYVDGRGHFVPRHRGGYPCGVGFELHALIVISLPGPAILLGRRRVFG